MKDFTCMVFLSLFISLYFGTLKANTLESINANSTVAEYVINDPIYVKADATGNNDGTSWQDAYLNLQDALAAAQEGSIIWIASGTYYPDPDKTNRNKSFLIDKNLEIYGGFSGMEQDISERDSTNAPTIFSGDLNDNDLSYIFETNRLDNAVHIMVIHTEVSNSTIIDGITISGGYANGTTNDEDHGGGMLIYGAPIIRNVLFTENFSVGFGGAVAIIPTNNSDIHFENCRFNRNEGFWGGGLSVNNLTAGELILTHCTISENEGGWAGGIYLRNSNASLQNLEILNNKTTRQGGGVRVITSGEVSGIRFKLENSLIKENEASFGGGLYFLNFSASNVFEINNSIIEQNVVKPLRENWEQGGAGLCMFLDTSAIKNELYIRNSKIINNQSSSSGGGLNLFYSGGGQKLSISSVQIVDNQAEGLGGGLITNIGPGSLNFIGRIDSSLFENNFAAIAGGGLIVDMFGDQNNGQVFINHNQFINNRTGINGGGLGISTLNGAKSVTLNGNQFEGNEAGSAGGGLGTYLNDGVDFEMTNSYFKDNSANVIGGGFYLNGTNTSTFNALISHSIFEENQSPIGAGMAADSVMSIFSDGSPTAAKIEIQNSLLFKNGNSSSALSIAAFQEVNLVNLTIADNNSIGVGIGHNTTVDLQNNILSNPGYSEFGKATNNYTLNSLGGNLIRDNSFSVYATGVDLLNTEPKFNLGTYDLSEDSPAIDGGVLPDSIAALDLAGNQRIQGNGIDIGAYESPFTLSSLDKARVAANFWQVSPNPASKWVTINIDNSWLGLMELKIFNDVGQEMNWYSLQKNSTIYKDQLDISFLAPGIYFMVLSNERNYSIQKFVVR